ncbi:MAG TPA: glycoside hydrolase family 97 protein [Balneolaceae bacterium]|nr:glycoside hydrolase family 97 protein [Balneolaceae bacterium]
MNKSKKYRVLCLICVSLLLIDGCSKRHQTTVQSPDKNVQLTFSLNKGIPNYKVSYQGKVFILPSPLGMKFKNHPALHSNFAVIGTRRSSADRTWEPLYGTTDTVRNQYRQMTVQLRGKKKPHRRLNLIFRAYNDGIAFRYQIPKQKNMDSLSVTDEQTTFHFADNYIGFPLKRTGFGGNYEGRYIKQNLGNISPDTLVAAPLLLHLNNGWAAVTEADLTGYSGMSLTRIAGDSTTFVSDLAPLPNDSTIKAKVKTPFNTPWRTIMLGKRAGSLITSNLIMNLNKPSQIKDTSFIKPGQVIWPWWNGRIADHLKYSGQPSTSVMKYYIDFAAKHHIQALLVDAGWYSTERAAWASPKKQNPLTMAKSRKDHYNIHKVIDYGKKKGVAVYVWVLAKTLKKNPKKVISTYAKWGIKGIKVDSYGGDNQVHVSDIQHFARLAAKYHLMMDFHGAYLPTGWGRTYPNLMTREGVMGLEHSKGSPHPKAIHNVTIPYTRMLMGAMDYTPGAFDLDGTKNHPKHVQTTRAQQIAMYVVYYSPLQMLVDYPGVYKKNPKQFQFVRDIPTTWDESKFIDGKPAEYIVMARRHGKNWYIGAMTNKSSRKVKIPLNFLKKGQKYKARILKDAPDAGKNPQDVSLNSRIVTSTDTIMAQLAGSGGAAVILSPQ